MVSQSKLEIKRKLFCWQTISNFLCIIILLILAGITISQLSGSGLFENAKLAEQKSKEAQEKEEGILDDYANEIDKHVNATRNPLSSQTVLYENADGLQTLGDFNLSKDIDDYNRFTVYCRMGGWDYVKYFEIYEKGKYVLLDAGFKADSGYYRDASVVLYLPTTGNVANLSNSALTQNGGYFDQCNIWIYKIVGYTD